MCILFLHQVNDLCTLLNRFSPNIITLLKSRNSIWLMHLIKRIAEVTSRFFLKLDRGAEVSETSLNDVESPLLVGCPWSFPPAPENYCWSKELSRKGTRTWSPRRSTGRRERRTCASTAFRVPCKEASRVSWIFAPSWRDTARNRNLKRRGDKFVIRGRSFRKVIPQKRQRWEKRRVGYQPPTLSTNWGLLINSKFCGFRSMWQTLWSRRYFSANASCCRNLRHVLSGSLCFFFMKLDKSPPSQYSITMYMCLFVRTYACFFIFQGKRYVDREWFLIRSVVRD